MFYQRNDLTRRVIRIPWRQKVPFEVIVCIKYVITLTDLTDEITDFLVIWRHCLTDNYRHTNLVDITIYGAGFFIDRKRQGYMPLENFNPNGMFNIKKKFIH